MISEGSRDTENWSNDAENSALNYIFIYVQIESSCTFLVKKKIFDNITAFAVFFIQLIQAWWTEDTYLSNITNLSVQKLLTCRLYILQKYYIVTFYIYIYIYIYIYVCVCYSYILLHLKKFCPPHFWNDGYASASGNTLF